MAYDPGAIDATLAAAVGDEPELIAELREAFVDSAYRAVKAMETSVAPSDWRAAALRLKGLAASFGAVRLLAIATEASESLPHAPQMLQRVRRAVERI
ncbi:MULTISPECIES: Hpt domain-containing protein [unclassified Sphingomonas]|uniref:Hpt domain-containing protein n=1 Tax=unclassified Sphingomonas TaxID=196159 RepID=UPI000BD0ED0E|nr:MAG: Hpt domain-containing protein [Sphingomonas sp. 12-62-6]OYX37111.1 MAG: Hpt domain-containing protein [Sphingomonas sp. 32-62-10]OYY67120.1 MAG: Hpt domain-containing protein [Sphingomonas sp. 28-62-11]